MKYLSNAFSLSMIPYDRALIEVRAVTASEFCQEIVFAESAIGHESTAKLVSQMCEAYVPVSRKQITLQHGDELYVIQILERLPEGKVLSEKELEEMLKAGKIRFFKVHVYA